MTQEAIQRLNKILDTVKYADESWADVLERINKDGGIDAKSLRRILGVVLDEIYDKKD